jgi:hypothetical protein
VTQYFFTRSWKGLSGKESQERGHGMSKDANICDRTFSTRRHIGYAVFITIFFLLLHALGFREYTSAISGILTGYKETVFGLIYVFVYFAFIGVVPVLLIAAVLLTICGRFFSSKKSIPSDN